MGKEFICLWMGNDFINSYYVALFLIIPGVVSLTQDIANNYLVAINEIKYRAFDYIGTAVISILLSFVLTPKYGAVGAALASGIGILSGHVIAMNVIYYKVFKIDVLRFFKECHLKLSIPLLLSCLVSYIVQKFFPTSNLTYFSLKVLIVTWCYVVFMWLFGINDYEKELLSSAFASLKRRIIKK
jgi:O-antigen/teichoic acid export membrane protein